MPPEATVPGLILWPGVAQPLRGSFTLSHGTAPSVATIEMTPQAGAVATEGTLALTYASVTVGFPGARLKEGSLQFTRQGRLWQLSIEDTRWRWRYGSISGVYNRRTPDGALEDAAVLPGGDLPPRIKTPQQLALLCWQAMPWDGVTVFDLSLLPNDSYPTVEWDDENPAQALERLCDDLGCRVVYQQPGVVRLIPMGLGGAVLQNVGLLQQTDTAAPPPPPRYIEVVGEPIRYQTYLKLEAVGEDTDGRTVPIAALSYAPAAGWGGEIPPDFAGLAGRARALAQKTVYKWYRVTADSPVPLDNEGACIVGWDGQGYAIENPGRRVTHRWQVEGFDNTQAIQGNDPVTNERAPIPAVVIGRYTTGQLGFVDSTEGDPYPYAFVIDGEHGLVQFADHVWRVNAGQVEPGLLYLVVAVSPRDPDTGAPTRFRYRIEANPGGSGVLTVRRDDIKCYVIGTYGAADYAGIGVPEGQTNLEECRQQASYYALAALSEVQDRGGAERTYAGILDVPPDGAIHQVGWEVGPQGCTTRLSFHREWDWKVPTYRERRADARLTRGRLEQVAADVARRREWARMQRRLGR